MAESTEPKGPYLVVESFRDMSNFDLTYEVGEDVSHFPEDRLKQLVTAAVVKGPDKPEETSKDTTGDENSTNAGDTAKVDAPVIPLGPDGKPLTKAQIKALEKKKEEEDKAAAEAAQNPPQ